jgi:transcription elongation factor GreB
MSKAFLRESDFGELPDVPRPMAVLPPGAKNYLTEQGAVQLRQELAQLIEEVRPPLAADPNDADTRRRLQSVDQRIRHLQESLRTAEIVPETPRLDDVVRFGSRVLVREKDGTEVEYRIVGVDETELGTNRISWQSPLAKALLNTRPGERIGFTTPRGLTTLDVMSVD